ncbi:hypothetical protein HAT2_00054 [Candidatus Similichlamydia laticola]|uniref:Uncharacterized protein n=1 Tax=Candidatus Similichlamydia laticola TaxID=2170265 RepID=A0A369KLE3_9BACT|nr:hypothetical protein HAT2_00054 [Candidatus Similichlamydia laticola]
MISLSQLRGVFIFLIQERNIALEEYSATKVKCLFTGKGGSRKQDMIQAVSKCFGLNADRLNDNCADALALAYCSFLSAREPGREK